MRVAGLLGANALMVAAGIGMLPLLGIARSWRQLLFRCGLGYLCGIHMKPSMHRALVAELGLDEGRAAYLDDTGHMSGVDALLGLDRAARAGKLADGDLVLLLAAGTGYTWAASVVRWGALA